MDFYFLNATDAAAELNLRQSQRQWTPSQVLREAKAGRLPVCFDFSGELLAHSVDGKPRLAGESPKILDFDGVVRSLMPPATDGVCGFAVPVEIQEAHTIKFSHKDGTLTRGINLPTEFPYGGRIKLGHNVECWLEDADVPPSAFLFRNDDLEMLVPASQADSARQAPETPPSVPVEPVQAAPAAPPEAVLMSPQAVPVQDPERRLARLRALGGTEKYKHGEWKFTGITELVAIEKSEGRKRSDEKTIRADLREAADNEREAKQAGFGSGLGQR